MSFRIQSLPWAPFAPYFDMSDQELREHRALIRTANKRPGFPCRVSLVDASIGERVLLVNYEHHTADNPYRSSHAIYVRQNAEPATCDVGQVPELFRSRLMSVRAFDAQGLMVAADVIDGREIEAAIERMLSVQAADYLHLHYAKPGCYAARADRA